MSALPPVREPRYYLALTGCCRWHIKCGTGTRSLAVFWSWRKAERIRQELECAYRDGVHVGGTELLAARDELARKAAYARLANMPRKDL